MIKYVIIGIIFCAFYLGFCKLRTSIKRFSNQLFGTSSLIEGYNKQKRELSVTPKSVSSMTKVYLPLILRDFPNFNLEQFKTKAENMLISALCSISQNDISKLQASSTDLKQKVSLIIDENVRLGRVESFDDIKIYQTEITNYKKQNGTCLITLQSSVSYLHYIVSNGKIIEGDNTLTNQTKYNISLIYIQDVNKLDSSTSNAVGTSCPNCGAPITALGNKTCEYCNMAVSEINIYVWSISDFKKL